MFNNNFGVAGNNGNSGRNVNTRIRTFYSDLSCFQMSYWNDNISIKLNPFSGLNADGIRQYDYNRKVTTALTQDNCLALAKGIKDVLLPVRDAYDTTGKFSGRVCVGISLKSKNSSVCIEYKEDETNGNVPTFYLTIYTNIGEDGKAPKDGVFSYKFAKVNLAVGYDPDAGTNAEVKMVDSEFMFFYEKLRTMSDISGTAAHSVNNESFYKSNSNSGNGGFNNSGFAQNGSGSFNLNNPQNSYSAPVSDFSSDEFSFVGK